MVSRGGNTTYDRRGLSRSAGKSLHELVRDIDKAMTDLARSVGKTEGSLKDLGKDLKGVNPLLDEGWSESYESSKEARQSFEKLSQLVLELKRRVG